MVDESKMTFPRGRKYKKPRVQLNPWHPSFGKEDMETIWSDKPAQDWRGKSERTQSLMSQLRRGAGWMMKAEHVSPHDLSLLGFGSFYGKREGREDKYEQNKIVKRKVVTELKKANCQDCGQIIRVHDERGFESLVWDMYNHAQVPSEIGGSKCDKCNSAMAYNFSLEHFRRASHNSAKSRSQEAKQDKQDAETARSDFSEMVEEEN